MRIVIGMPRMGKDPFRIYMKRKYVQSLARAGASVRWIDPEDPVKAVQQIIECDGLLLPGGEDVNPELYFQKPGPLCGRPNPLRDAAEIKMLEAFIPTGKPIFCICRGVQLLNVFCGGTLHQDLKAIQKCGHSDFASRSRGCHRVRVTPGSQLHGIVGEDTLVVNSLHHQAADRIGGYLKVSAVSGDGIVEAVEVPIHPFCIGVQWHPEHMSAKNKQQQKLFDAFVKACVK